MLTTLARLSALAAAVGLAACTAPDQGADASRNATSPGGYTEADFECLREAVYHEAGAKSFDGGRAVGNVIINRARDPRFPNSVCGVIADGEAKGRCQFSYRCDGRPEVLADRIKLDNATRAAKQVLEAPADDVTSGALFFHAAWMKPGWFGTLHRTTSLGGNIFYR